MASPNRSIRNFEGIRILFDFHRAALYADSNGVSRAELTEALLSGQLPAGVLPKGGWVIDAAELEAWVRRRTQ